MARAAVVALVVGLLGATANAAPPPGSSTSERRAYYADLLVQRAAKPVERDRACRPRARERGPVAGAPSAAFMSSLAVLRRPAAPGEDESLFPAAVPVLPPIYAGYERAIVAADGARVTIFPLHDINANRPRPKRCAAALRKRVARAIATRSRAFKRAARKALRSEIQQAWLPRRREGMIVFVNSQGVQADLSLFRRAGAFLMLAGDQPGATLYGVVPDGVASIDFSLGGYKTTGSVRDNVVVARAPLTLSQTVPVRQVWRAADGHVIRVVSGL